MRPYVNATGFAGCCWFRCWFDSIRVQQWCFWSPLLHRGLPVWAGDENVTKTGLALGRLGLVGQRAVAELCRGGPASGFVGRLSSVYSGEKDMRGDERKS